MISIGLLVHVHEYWLPIDCLHIHNASDPLIGENDFGKNINLCFFVVACCKAWCHLNSDRGTSVTVKDIGIIWSGVYSCSNITGFAVIVLWKCWFVFRIWYW